jgi:hypothetical protein
MHGTEIIANKFPSTLSLAPALFFSPPLTLLRVRSFCTYFSDDVLVDRVQYARLLLRFGALVKAEDKVPASRLFFESSLLLNNSALCDRYVVC